jgi:hypothetical protein
MSHTLTEEQAKFLRYLCDYHRGFGRSMTINSILKKGEYHYNEVKPILWVWAELISEIDSTQYFTKKYGKPFKYLKS